MPRPHPQAPVPAAVTLRRATLQDLAAIEALERASFRSDRLSHRALRHWLRAANGLFLVAVSAGQLLGCALAVQRSDSTAARLYSIAIARAARGQGLGTRLLKTMERRLRADGFSALRLEVAVNNAAAIAMYSKQGYRVFGRKPGYYQDGRDALRMQKPL
ncbi:MAG: GNAT family N-acetyltransferase [Pseudohongiellaceae bacterium]|jgi:ribosomal-protein-alanine N-acetyltransferase